MRFQDKVAVITGGARGIGFAYASRFATDGCRVVIGDMLDREGEAAANAIRSNGGDAQYVHCDVRQKADVDSLMDNAVKTYGRLDILIANAGILDHGGFFDITEEAFDRVMAINVKGVLLCGQSAARKMIAGGRGGVIINIASTAAILANDDEGCYAASKGAVNMLTRTMALCLADHGIRVVAIAPGATRTPMMMEPLSDPARRKVIEARTPLRRPAEPDEIAAVAAFLASEDASYITGQTMYVEGGRLVLNYMMSTRD